MADSERYGFFKSHIALPHGKRHIGLMSFPVAVCVHLMTGVNIQHTTGFRTTQRTGVEGDRGIRVIDSGLPQTLTVLGVFHNAEDLHTAGLAAIALPEDEEVVLASRVEAAPGIQLWGNLSGSQEMEGTVVLFDGQVLYPCKPSFFICI